MGSVFRVGGITKGYHVETRPARAGDRNSSAAAMRMLLWVATFDSKTASELRQVWSELAGRGGRAEGPLGEDIQDRLLLAVDGGLITVSEEVPEAPPGPRPAPPAPVPPKPQPPREVEDTATYTVLVRDEHDRPLPGVRVAIDAPGFRRVVTDGGGSAVFRDAPAHGLTARLSEGLPEALAPLLSRPPRDRDPTGAERVVVTPATQQRGFQLRPDATTIVTVIARTDVSFDLPPGWQELEVDAPGPWELSRTDHRAHLRLLADGSGRRVTLRCRRHRPAAFTGTFPPSPLWTSDRERIVQKGETPETIARRYLDDAVELLFTLNPLLNTIGDGLAVAPKALTLPAASIPQWLSIPREVKETSRDTAEFDTFATIDVDTLHDALFLGHHDEAWAILSSFPRQSRSDERPLSAQDQLSIYTQCMNAEIESVAANDD